MPYLISVARLSVLLGLKSLAQLSGRVAQYRKTGWNQAQTGHRHMGRYIALIHKEADSDYGVSFPDVPGCIAAGATLDEAREMAEQALAFHLDGLEEDGEALPEPFSLETVMGNPENRDGIDPRVRAEPPRQIRTDQHHLAG